MNACLLCETHDAAGGQLCPGCTKATLVRLESLPTLYDGLQAFLAPSSTGGQGRGSKPVHAPLPVSESVLDLRGPGGMVGIVEDWLGLVREERGMAPVVPVGAVEPRLAAAVAGLRNQLPWIAISWPLAGAFAEEIRELANNARSILDPDKQAVRGTRIGQCPAIDPSGTLCGAVLRLLPGEKAVRCEWCDTRYPPYTWAQLKAWIDEDARAGNAA
ncbi:hypothetical protein [Streptomyces sp. B1I3]|uniref:hypothetical protein n=1 Tax=Streptomyces sp. B1I3 TaxID=3042264 RepID=UPI00278971BC|nr:hypothetical protein [Streptomyces sp. B1I3]MDQ0795599.1 hypothetical protein [Streptomyces sp. B1I3]